MQIAVQIAVQIAHAVQVQDGLHVLHLCVLMCWY